MTLLLSAVVGYLGGRLVWLLSRDILRAPVFARVNYRGTAVATAGGLVLALVLIGVEAARALVASAGVGDFHATAEDRAVTIAVLGYSMLGLLDDVAGEGSDRGFTGHLRALGRGRLTTGGAKLFVGAAVAVVAVDALGIESLGRLLADAALVALAANLANLFDRAPGRVIKISSATFAVLAVLAVAAGAASGLGASAIVMGAALAVFVDDLHERVMLGDTGANALGAALAIGAVVVLSPGPRTIALGVVAALNVTSEFVSFSRIIEAVPPLRAADRAGRRQ